MSYQNNPPNNLPSNGSGSHPLPPRPAQPFHHQADLRILASQNIAYHAISSPNGLSHNNPNPTSRGNKQRRNAISGQGGVPRITLSQPASRETNLSGQYAPQPPKNGHQYIFVAEHGIFPVGTALEHLRLGRDVFDYEGYELKVVMGERGITGETKVVRDLASKGRSRSLVGAHVDQAVEDFLVGVLERRDSGRGTADPVSSAVIAHTNRLRPAPNRAPTTPIDNRYLLPNNRHNGPHHPPLSAPLPQLAFPYSQPHPCLHAFPDSFSPGPAPSHSTLPPLWLSSPQHHSREAASGQEACMDQQAGEFQSQAGNAKPSGAPRAQVVHHRRTSSAPAAGRGLKEERYDEREDRDSDGVLNEEGWKYGPSIGDDNRD